MDPFTSGGLLIGLLIMLLVSGMPIAVALSASGMIGVLLMRPLMAADYMLASFPYTYTANYSFVVLPLFLFMGQMAFSARLSHNAFEAGQRWLSRVQGGLAIATVFACAVFSAVCGSSIATASTMARVAIPEMLKRGYKPLLAGSSIAAGGTLGVLIPPSGILVIYSFATGTSLVHLFLAALIPGLLTALVYMGLVYVMVKVRPDLAGSTADMKRWSWRERFEALGSTWEVALLFVVVMGSIYLGLATPTEASALGALLAMLMVARRRNAMKNLKEGLLETGAATSTVFFLVIGAGLFGLALNMTQFPTQLAAWIVGYDLPHYVLFALIVLLFVVLGAFVDGMSMILITMPVVFPIVLQMDLNPVLFGIVVVKAVEVGCITPPVGLNVFVVKGSFPELPLKDLYYGCIPFVLVELGLIALFYAFPDIVLYLVPGG